MRITNPVLVVDVSDWVDHLNIHELEDAGVESVIVGWYFKMVKGRWVLSPKSRQHSEAVAKSNLILQTYVWDDCTFSAQDQVGRYCDALSVEGLPVKWTWADQEQWWTDWAKWYAAQKTRDYSKVPKADPGKLYRHNEEFIVKLHAQTPSGVYTNKGFVKSWAPAMDTYLPDYLSWIPQYGRHPNLKTWMTWEELRSYWMPKYDITLSDGQLPKNVCGHQFTGDRCILPGSYNVFGIRLPMDVSVFERPFIEGLWGNAPRPPRPPDLEPTPKPNSYRLTNGAWVLSGPGNQYKARRHINIGTIVTVTQFVGAWARLAEGDYVARSLLVEASE